MSNVAKLKKKAAEFEQKKQFDKALAVYRQILDDLDPSDAGDVDVGLYNRVGDLLLRQGSGADAVNYYEKAVDLYAEGGFFNNAIALCNKILRQSPGRSSIYYKLGKISAKKGFKSDAKQNFLEYADRMQKAGQLDEAFRALKEFADLCPDQDDIRLMLAEQLAKRERKTEALEQLQTLYERFEGEGRASEARATLDRMKAIDPQAEPVASKAPKAQKSSELVFLDVDFDAPGTRPAARPAPRPTVKIAPPPEPEPVVAPPSPVDDLPLIDMSAPSAAPLPGPADVAAPLDPARFGAMRLVTPAEAPAVRQSEHDLALPGDLPMLDDEPLGGGAGDDLELMVPDLDDVGTGLDDLTPPIGRPTGNQPAIPTADFGLDIQHTAAPQGLDANAFRDGMLDVVPTSFDSAPTAPAIAPLAGFEQTTLGDEPMAPAGFEIPVGDLPLVDGGVPADSLDAFDAFGGGQDDGLLMIEDDSSYDAGGDLALIMPEAEDPAPARPTVRLTPAEIAALDAAARAQVPPGTFAPELLDTGLPADMDAPTSTGEAAFDLLPEESYVAEAPHAAVPAADDGFDFLAPTPARPSGSRLDVLFARVDASPEDWPLRREYAEALLESGDREGGLAELEQTMIGLERAGDLETARSVVAEIIRTSPESVRHHQKLVEYAFRTNDRPRLIDAYLGLGDALFRSGQPDKARVVYQRVVDLAPDDVRVAAALAALGDVARPTPAPVRKTEAVPRQSTALQSKRYTGDAGRTPESVTPSAPVAAAPMVPAGDDSFVNLGDLLRADDGPRSTRMVVAEEAPSGDEQADFADMLRKFKQGVAENVDDEDYDSHYDLGVAYKEMGLVDEAIAEFQKALRATERRVRTYEALGQCFLEKKQWQVAATILQRALAEPGQGDEQLVGVLYLLGYASEALQKWSDAITYYQRVFAVDIQFRDVTERLTAVEKQAR